MEAGARILITRIPAQHLFFLFVLVVRRIPSVFIVSARHEKTFWVGIRFHRRRRLDLRLEGRALALTG